MGTFIRVWRRDWARMSRAQLAIAVSSSCTRRNTVTADMVYAWEAGQPPKATEQLLALTKVMQRHPLGNVPGMGGLSQLEIDQFREVAFASLAGRQYPEFFPDDSIAHRRDVEATGEALRPSAHGPRLPVNIVHLVASIKELERAMSGEIGPSVSPSQERRQRAALACLRAALGHCHVGAGRLRQATSLHRVNADFLNAHFGPRGLGGELSVLGQRFHSAHSALHIGRWVGQARRAARGLVQISEEGRDEGERHWCLRAFFNALCALEGSWHKELLPRADEGERVLEAAKASRSALLVDDGHYALFRSSMATGAPDQAARWLTELQHWPDENPLRHVMWEDARGDLALVRGDYNEAQESFERALAIARDTGQQFLERWMLRAIEDCERARRPGRHIAIPPNGTRPGHRRKT